MSSPVGPVVVLIGPSGSGKSSVVRALCDRGLLRVHPTWTTRPRRPDEAEGSVEHQFVTEDEFDRLDAEGAFLDTVSMFGLSHRYGLPPIRRSDDGRVDAVMLRAPLVDRFRRVVPHLFVLQIEDTEDRVLARLRERGGSAQELNARLKDNKREIATGRHLADWSTPNDSTLEDLIDRVGRVIFAQQTQGWAWRQSLPPEQRPNERMWRVLSVIGIVLAVLLALVGLAIVAAFVLFLVAMDSWASNK